ncbi:MAG: geranylgeranyl reductase family protein [Chloroflexota bacterium]|nr:geranylgeranyl reductase family protein [Chloroflexota bacterium]
MKDIYDVVIVGAGPGGSAAAHYLSSQGFNVLLLDKFTFPRDKTCGDALTPRALRVLDEMGMLDDLMQVGHHLEKVAFFAPKGHAVTASIPQKDSRSGHLLFIPRLILDNMILERALASGAQFQSPVRVTEIVQDADCVVVKGEYHNQATTYKARMAIVAVGANIKLLLRMGLLKKAPQVMLCSRAYFEGMTDMPDAAQCRFDGVPLPGYGWVFPVSNSSANVGVGFLRAGLTARWMPKTARTIFDSFIQTPPLQSILAGAQRVGPIKGYPLRIDFARSPTYTERVLLVGEAAGLVNPVTGEGIDYALESGKMAAEHLIHMFAANDLSIKHLAEYDQLLRERYQRLFVLCDRLRFLYLNPLVLNRVVRSVAQQNDLMEMFMNIVIENHNAYEGISARTISKVVFGKT